MLNVENLIALATLTGMEIVLGIDNIVFIAILVSKAPKEKQDLARHVGIGLALLSRLLLLFGISWIMGLTQPLLSIWKASLSGRDLILILGGMFLIGKATIEIHEKLEGSGDSGEGNGALKKASLASVLFQIVMIDIVFSLDSVITAVGMVNQIWIMVIAMVAAVIVMLVFARTVSNLVHRHPTLKILALSFLLLIGVLLLAEGFGTHINKGMIYFAMAFSLGVEFLNMRLRGKSKRGPVELRDPVPPNDGSIV